MSEDKKESEVKETPKETSDAPKEDNTQKSINASKDASRTKVIEMYPSISDRLRKKKDVNKADAILIARYFKECKTQFAE